MYKMFGFDKKVLHLHHDSVEPVTFDVQVDILGNGHWVSYKQITVDAKGYLHHTFAPGFTAHWIRVVSDKECTATATFFYN